MLVLEGSLPSLSGSANCSSSSSCWWPRSSSAGGRGSSRAGGTQPLARRPDRRGLVYWAFTPRAGVVKLADARDSKSRGVHSPCRFDSDLRHQPSLSTQAKVSAVALARRPVSVRSRATAGKPATFARSSGEGCPMHRIRAGEPSVDTERLVSSRQGLRS